MDKPPLGSGKVLAMPAPERRRGRARPRLPNRHRSRMPVIAERLILRHEPEAVLDGRREDQPVSGIAWEARRKSRGRVGDRRGHPDRSDLGGEPAQPRSDRDGDEGPLAPGQPGQSNQEIAATTSSSTSSRTSLAWVLTRCGSADHQWTRWVSSRTALTVHAAFHSAAVENKHPPPAPMRPALEPTFGGNDLCCRLAAI